MSKNSDMKIIKLEDYTPPRFSIDSVSLHFALEPKSTEVTSELKIKRQGMHKEALKLDGEDLELIEILLDGKPLSPNDYKRDEESLEIANLPDAFTLAIKTRIAPEANTRLEGLYLSNGIYCTQCEAEGFRRITYFIDRPDVMTCYDVTIEAPKDFTAVLSNGNLISDEVKNDKRICHWQDPFPKPCYLFALVAGKLAKVSDNFTTMNGRDVELNIYLTAGYESRASYAMDALKRSMRWDETRFGLEYDLGIFNIAAIDDFNMGAMENKSLNVFNAKYVLADSKTATDMDYMFIESIIGHEYFHNWSGNRVTCRDWFQLSLKEGLTVFRDQEFSGDMNSKSHVRIMDVIQLKASQFPEDVSKLSHPVRPAQYAEINNFYTATVYEKGAEVVRLLHSLLGEQGFCKGLSLYFDRHDGQAVTCDDFVSAMRDANNAKLQDFETWYSQSGTPRINYTENYDSESQTYNIKIRQHTEPTADNKNKKALPLPLQFALLDSAGNAQKLQCNSKDLLHIEGKDYFYLSKGEHEFTFANVKQAPQLSLNRNFSAPVIIETPQSEAKLAFHMAHDDDSYLRWEATQNYNMQILNKLIASSNYDVGKHHQPYVEAFKRVLENAKEDKAYSALLLTLPSESLIADQQEVVDVEAIHLARKNLKSFLAKTFADEFAELYESLASDEPYKPVLSQIGRRALRNLALSYKCSLGDVAEAEAHYFTADNMTDKMAAMEILTHAEPAARQKAFADFYDNFKDDAIVLDKWFGLQARSHADDALGNIRDLISHKDFNMKNPNRLRSVVGVFAFANSLKFHSPDGAGYDFVLKILQQVDTLNPQTAARLLGAFANCEKLKSPMPEVAKKRLELFREGSILSKDSSEIVGKMLDG